LRISYVNEANQCVRKIVRRVRKCTFGKESAGESTQDEDDDEDEEEVVLIPNENDDPLSYLVPSNGVCDRRNILSGKCNKRGRRVTLTITYTNEGNRCVRKLSREVKQCTQAEIQSQGQVGGGNSEEVEEGEEVVLLPNENEDPPTYSVPATGNCDRKNVISGKCSRQGRQVVLTITYTQENNQCVRKLSREVKQCTPIGVSSVEVAGSNEEVMILPNENDDPPSYPVPANGICRRKKTLKGKCSKRAKRIVLIITYGKVANLCVRKLTKRRRRCKKRTNVTKQPGQSGVSGSSVEGGDDEEIILIPDDNEDPPAYSLPANGICDRKNLLNGRCNKRGRRVTLTITYVNENKQCVRKLAREVKQCSQGEGQGQTEAEAQAKARAQAEAQARALAEARARAQAQAKAQAEAQAKTQAEALARARALAQSQESSESSVEQDSIEDSLILSESDDPQSYALPANGMCDRKNVLSGKCTRRGRQVVLTITYSIEGNQCVRKHSREVKQCNQNDEQAQALALVREQAQAEALARARSEALARARAEAQARAQAEALARARAQAEALAKTRAEALARARAEAQAQAQAQGQSVETESSEELVLLPNDNDDPLSYPVPASGICDRKNILRGRCNEKKERSVMKITYVKEGNQCMRKFAREVASCQAQPQAEVLPQETN
jgi:hypothetical protein